MNQVFARTLRPVVTVLFAAMIASCSHSPAVLTVCGLSQDFARYRNQLIQVRGVYYNGLRETCAQECLSGPWPSFIDLGGTSALQPGQTPPPFVTDEQSWADLLEAEHTVELAAKDGKRLEVWATAIGQLKTRPGHPPGGPCTLIRSENNEYAGYPARLIVQRFSDIEVRENPGSRFDYSKIEHGAP